MDMISLSVKLNKLRFKVSAHSGGDSSLSVKNVFTESTASVLGNKYQMHMMQSKDEMSVLSVCPDILIFSQTQNIIISC